MGRKCSYPECKSTEGLHSLPSNREMAHRWLNALGRIDMPSASVYVCNLHFTRECFSNYAEVEMGFKKQLLLNPDAVPTPVQVVTQHKRGLAQKLSLKQGSVPTVRGKSADERKGTVGNVSGTLPSVRHVACQTDPPETKSVATQLSMKTLPNTFRSKATQARVSSRDCGMCTLTFPLDSPILFLQPTIVKRPAKRPRLSLTDEEEGPSECSLSMVVHEPEDLT
uniref:uncharacterized protein LOC124064431 isoform X1 n=1 Tax=Scatophagus argus TaxID=75038 RepID=UPI001ED81E22|nr:uncharacterized protein LOC124064431 isoform X1 [Scatophagus argus]